MDGNTDPGKFAEPVVQRRRLPHFLREKTSERVYPKTLFVTAATAATVALISSRLTNTMNSLLLVGLVSMLTGLVSEVYRLTVELTQGALARAVAKGVDSRLGELTGEIPAVEEPAEESQPTQADLVESERHSLPWLFLHRLFVSRWAVPLSFALVALLTVGASFAVGQVTASPEVHLTRSVSTTEDLSPAQAEAIEESARATAARRAARAGDEANQLTYATRDELLARMAILEQQLQKSRELRAQDRQTTAELHRALLAQARELAQLQAEVDRLSVPSSTPNPSSSPTPTP